MNENADEQQARNRRLAILFTLVGLWAIGISLKEEHSGVRLFLIVLGSGLIFLIGNKILKSRTLLGVWRKLAPFVFSMSLLALIVGGLANVDKISFLLAFLFFVVVVAIGGFIFFRLVLTMSRPVSNRFQRYIGAYTAPLPWAIVLFFLEPTFPEPWTFLLIAAPVMFVSAVFSAALLMEAKAPEPRAMPLTGLVFHLIVALTGSLVFGERWSLLIAPMVFITALIAAAIVYTFEPRKPKFGRGAALLLLSFTGLSAGAWILSTGLLGQLPGLPAIGVVLGMAAVLAFCVGWVERESASGPDGSGGGHEGLFHVGMGDDADDADG